MAFKGLRYSRGPFQTREAEPASAFSAGDILQYDSNSSLSGIDTSYPSGTDIAGVALSASADSIGWADGVTRVPYIVPQADTYFLSECTPASQFTAGQEVDFDVDGNGRPVVVTSQNSVRAVVIRGTQEIQGQSDLSRVEIGLIQHAGNLDHS